MKSRTILFLALAVALALVVSGCSRKHEPLTKVKLDMTAPEIDASQVADYVSVASAEIVPDAAGMMAQLKLVIDVKKDFDGKVLVLDAYDSKGPGAVLVGTIPLPAPEDGKITTTIQSIEMWQQSGKGVLRLAEPAA